MCGDWGECGRVQIKCVETEKSVREFRSSVWRLRRVRERTDQVCGDWGEGEREQIKCVETGESVRVLIKCLETVKCVNINPDIYIV